MVLREACRISKQQKVISQTHKHREQTCVPKGEGRLGSLGLVNAKYYM